MIKKILSMPNELQGLAVCLEMAESFRGRMGFLFEMASNRRHFAHATLEGLSGGHRMPWRVLELGKLSDPHNNFYFTAQVERQEGDWYFHLPRKRDFYNPLAGVRTASHASAFIGCKVSMYHEGLLTSDTINEELTIRRFRPGKAKEWVLTGSNGSPWAGQSHNPCAPYYITSFFWAEEAKSPAESLSRIFLGG